VHDCKRRTCFAEQRPILDRQPCVLKQLAQPLARMAADCHECLTLTAELFDCPRNIDATTARIQTWSATTKLSRWPDAPHCRGQVDRRVERHGQDGAHLAPLVEMNGGDAFEQPQGIAKRALEGVASNDRAVSTAKMNL